MCVLVCVGFGVCVCVLVCVCVVCGVCVCGVCGVCCVWSRFAWVKIQFVWGGVAWVVRIALPRDRPPAGPPSRGTALPRDRPPAGPPFRRTALRRTAQNFAFFPSPATISFFFSLSLGVFSCRGFTRQPENSKRAHLRVLALQTPPKFHEKTPREREKKNENGSGRGKKREILGPPPFGAPPFGAATFGAPTLRGTLWLHPFWTPPFGPHPFTKPKPPSPGPPTQGQKTKQQETYPCPKSPMPQPNRPKSAWPKLAEPKSVFKTGPKSARAQVGILRQGLSRPNSVFTFKA